MSTKPPALVPFLALLIGLLPPPGSADPLKVTEVAPGVFVHQGVHQVPDARNHGEIANIGFVIGEHCVAAIDSGASPAEGQQLIEAIREKTQLPISYVVNTHVHPDHIYGNLAFKKEGARFIGHHKLGRAMAERARYYGERAQRDLGLTLTEESIVPPDLPVQDTLSIDLGGRALILTAHRTAHTDNDLSILDTKTRTLWLGDLLFMGHLPVIDGSLIGWLREIKRLRRTEADRVIPGHGPVSASWPLALISEEKYLQDLATQVRESLRKNSTIEQAMSEIKSKTPGDWLLYDEFHKRNVATAFAELEWEEESQEPTEE